MYHLCDNKRLTYCTLPYSILQYLDFYSAIMTLWCAAIVLANVPLQWISAFHLVGALFYGTLLFNSVAGVWSFVIPAFCTLLLVGSYWVRCHNSFYLICLFQLFVSKGPLILHRTTFSRRGLYADILCGSCYDSVWLIFVCLANIPAQLVRHHSLTMAHLYGHIDHTATASLPRILQMEQTPIPKRNKAGASTRKAGGC